MTSTNNTVFDTYVYNRLYACIYMHKYVYVLINQRIRSVLIYFPYKIVLTSYNYIYIYLKRIIFLYQMVYNDNN